jgi:hypothetical protein
MSLDRFTGYVKVYLVRGNKASYKYYGKINKKQENEEFKKLAEQYDCVVFYNISKEEFLDNVRE